MINTPYFDLQQSSIIHCPPSISNNPLCRSLICTCPNPTNSHDNNCPIFSVHTQELNMNFSSESMPRPPMNRTNIQRIVPTPPTHINNTMSLPSMKESMMATTVMPFTNSHLMKPQIDPLSSVTTIISHPPSFLNNTSTIRMPSMNDTNNFQQMPLNISQFMNSPTIQVNFIRNKNIYSRFYHLVFPQIHRYQCQ